MMANVYSMNKQIESPFWNGFFAGLAAPLTLFSSRPAPTFQMPHFDPLYRPAASATEALQGDIRRMGEDFSSAISRFNDEKYIVTQAQYSPGR
jgi:hypothetical protein